MYKDKIGIILPKREIPWVHDGYEQPTIIKHVYVTPDGYFPRMRDIATLFGKSKREIEYKRMKRTSPRFDGWYKINHPTVEDVERAIEEVNRMYRWFHILEDSCDLCNALDDSLFKEGCWLVSTTHNCGSDDQSIDEIKVTYSFKGTDYVVNLQDWFEGGSPHLQKEDT